jgi:hypothetical protein
MIEFLSFILAFSLSCGVHNTMASKTDDKKQITHQSAVQMMTAALGHAASGFCASLVSTTCVYPLDVIRTRMQAVCGNRTLQYRSATTPTAHTHTSISANQHHRVSLVERVVD